MTLQIDLPPELETKLHERAARAGKAAEAFALEAVEQKLRAPRSFAEILAPAHQAVRESGNDERGARRLS